MPIPTPANIDDLEGLEAEFLAPIAMIDGKSFRADKAYKFPWFQKNIIKGYVAQPLSGERMVRILARPESQTSGVH